MKYNEVSAPSSDKSKDGYHLNCYKKFVGLPKKYREMMKNNPIPDVPETNISSTSRDQGLETAAKQIGCSCNDPEVTLPIIQKNLEWDPDKCIWCNLVLRCIKGTNKRESLTTSSGSACKESILRYTTILNNIHMLTLLRDADFTIRKVRYYKRCRLDF